MKRVLVWLRIVDEYDGNISLTNIALMIVLGKLIYVQNASMVDVGSLLIALMSYQGKKLINKDAAGRDVQGIANQAMESVNTVAQRVDELASKMNGAMLTLGMKERR